MPRQKMNPSLVDRMAIAEIDGAYTTLSAYPAD